MDVDPGAPVVIDALVNTSTVRGAMVIGGSIPFCGIAQVPADQLGVVDLVQRDEVVLEATREIFEFVGLDGDWLKVDSLDGHALLTR